MMAKPMGIFELHYTMIKSLLMLIYPTRARGIAIE